MILTKVKKGIAYVLKTCYGCGDEWYAKRKQNRCPLCGNGLVIRTPANKDKNWDELEPEKSSKELQSFYRKAKIILQ